MKEKITELRQQGLSMRDIATQLGCSKTTVSYALDDDKRARNNANISKVRAEKRAAKKAEPKPKEWKCNQKKTVEVKPIEAIQETNLKPLKKSKKSKSKKDNPNTGPKLTNRNDKVFKTRDLNLAGLIKVRVNEKTEVYVKPGTDIAALKQKYEIKQYKI